MGRYLTEKQRAGLRRSEARQSRTIERLAARGAKASGTVPGLPPEQNLGAVSVRVWFVASVGCRMIILDSLTAGELILPGSAGGCACEVNVAKSPPRGWRLSLLRHLRQGPLSAHP